MGGIVPRGGRSRSLVIQLQERQYGRDEVVILGVPCEGYVDNRKLVSLVGGREITEGMLEGDKILVKTAQEGKEATLSDVLADNCLTCRFNNPVIFDALLGDAAPPMDA